MCVADADAAWREAGVGGEGHHEQQPQQTPQEEHSVVEEVTGQPERLRPGDNFFEANHPRLELVNRRGAQRKHRRQPRHP